MEAGASSEEHSPGHDFDPDRLSLRVRVTLAADRKSVDPVVAQVMQAVRDMKCVDGKEDAIELALQEALANAVVHGAKEDPSKIVECVVACDEQRGVLIIVRDPGLGFATRLLRRPGQGTPRNPDTGCPQASRAARKRRNRIGP